MDNRRKRILEKIGNHPRKDEIIRAIQAVADQELTMQLEDQGMSPNHVRALQHTLSKSSGQTTALLLDGIYGDKTSAAVKNFQASNGLVADGLAGSKTKKVLKGGSPDEKSLTEKDILDAARILGVNSDVVKAVAKVESKGDGFLKDGRVLILLERHHVYKYVKDNFGADAASEGMRRYPNVCYHGWDPKFKYGKYSEQHTRFDLVTKLWGIEAAIYACSYGKFQIMGFNYKSSGFTSLREFDKHMRMHERYHLQTFIGFVESNRKLHSAMRTKNWHGIARQFNGASYAKHNYHTRMQKAYNQIRTA